MSGFSLVNLITAIVGIVNGEVDLPILVQTILTAELASFGSDPIPAVIANAEKVFPDVRFRPVIVEILTRLDAFVKGGGLQAKPQTRMVGRASS